MFWLTYGERGEHFQDEDPQPPPVLISALIVLLGLAPEVLITIPGHS